MGKDAGLVEAEPKKSDILDQKTAVTIDETGLVWPAKVINKSARLKQGFNWPVDLSIFSFFITSLIAFSLGPMQLLFMMFCQDYNWVTNIYYPSAMRIGLLLSGFLSIVNLVAAVLAWRSHLKSAHTATLLSGGSATIIVLIWLSAFVLSLQPNQLAVVMVLAILIFLVAALLFSKRTQDQPHITLPLQILICIISACSAVSATLTCLYIANQKAIHAAEQAEISALKEIQDQAWQEPVPRTLSDLVVALCENHPYETIFISNNTPSGIFECKDAHDVYSVQSIGNESAKIVTGLATYLGTTYSDIIEYYFPNDHYLYRSFANRATPDELVLLLSASSEEELVTANLERLTNYLNQLQPDISLNVNIFYSDNLDTVLSTRDFILIAAVGTMALTDQLPHGKLYRSYLNDQIGTYIFDADVNLSALSELGADPNLYSYQTRDALKTKRHLSFSIPLDRTENFTTDSLHELLQNSFVDPS